MQPIQWHSETVLVTDIIPYEKNPRTFFEKGMADLRNSIHKFGYAEPVVLNLNHVAIGGHARHLIAKEDGEQSLECWREIVKHLPRYKERGVYGVIFEGIKRMNMLPGLVKVGGDCALPIEPLRSDFERLKVACHSNGLKFFAAENRLRAMGDSVSCCGVVGMEGFTPHVGNMSHMDERGDIPYTPGMMQPGTGRGLSGIVQTTMVNRALQTMSLADVIEVAKDTKTYREIMGIRVGGQELHQIEIPVLS